MTREEKIEMLRRIEAGGDLFNELNKNSVIVLIKGKYTLNGKEISKEQAERFTGNVVTFVTLPCEGSNFDKD